ncbi:hypothetical protein BGX27_009425 [Mortierella sp. AM989]|nr:hypothetical protein BGX27_009425 [Mortierella sp. AM989]
MNSSFSSVIKTTIINESSSIHKRLVSVFQNHEEENGCSPSLAQLFDAARDASSNDDDKDVINWLEMVVSAKFKQERQRDADDDVFASPVFFPSEESFQHLINTLNRASKTLDICVFTITDDQVSNAVIRAHERGVQVRIITDDDKADDQGSDARRMAKQNDIPVRVDGSPSHMHHKFMIIDNSLVVNGSYNWTKGARYQNREDLMITNSAKAVRGFKQEFEKLWDEFEQYELPM